MILTNIKISVRSALRNRWFSCLRLLSLSLGLTGCFLIALYLDYETSFDNFHQNSNEIYRVVEETKRSDGFNRVRPYTGTPLGQYLREVEEISSERVTILSRVLTNTKSSFRNNQLAFVEPGFLAMFSFPLIDGEPASVLSQPFQVVLTKSSAEKYFGEPNPIGKKLTIANKHELTVTGIMEDIPSNSHLQFDMLVSFATLELTLSDWSKHWEAPVMTYLKANDISEVTQLQLGLDRIAKRFRNTDNLEAIYSLERLDSIHLTWTSSSKSLIILAALGLILLAIALINYINLSSSLMLKRLPEMAIRRMVGATGRHVFILTATESFGYLLLSSLITLVLSELLMPVIESFTSVRLALQQFASPIWIIALLGALIVLAVITAGFSSILQVFRTPVEILRHSSATTQIRSLIRPGLIVLQLAMTTGLIAATIVTTSQSDYLLNKNLGFDPDNLIVLPIREAGLRQEFQTIKNIMSECDGITMITGSSKRPGEPGINALSYSTSLSDQSISLPTLWIDPDYLRTMKIQILNDANQNGLSADKQNHLFLLNQTAANKIGVKQLSDLSLEAYPGETRGATPWYQGAVSGITNDFNYRDLHFSLQPLVMISDPKRCQYLILRYDTNNIEQTISSIQKAWKTLDPQAPFEMSFLIDDISQNYQSESKQAMIISTASIFSILMSCLGLFGTITLAAQRRTREISIRKILGSSVRRIMAMLSTEYLILALVAFIISGPITYYFLNQWLMNFAHRVELGIMPFVISGVVSILITLISVTIPSIRAALINPAESLRTE